MLQDEAALNFIKAATEQEDAVFKRCLKMFRAVPPPHKDDRIVDSGITMMQVAFTMLLQQEKKMKQAGGWPESLREHESARTRKMRRALRTHTEDYFDAWYTRAKRLSPELA